MTGYHVTDRDRLKSILKRGLFPRDTMHHHFPGINRMIHETCVYLFTKLKDAKEWCEVQGRRKKRDTVIVNIKLDGRRKLRRDQCAYYLRGGRIRTLESSCKIFAKIKPDRIAFRTLCVVAAICFGLFGCQGMLDKVTGAGQSTTGKIPVQPDTVYLGANGWTISYSPGMPKTPV